MQEQMTSQTTPNHSKIIKDNGYHQIKVTKLQIRNFKRHHQKRQTRYRKEGYRVQQQTLKVLQQK